MLINKQSKKEICHSAAFGPDSGRRSCLETRLLDFLDSFDIYLFLYDPAYRQRLNDILELFTEEEFTEFERTHSRRFTVN